MNMANNFCMGSNSYSHTFPLPTYTDYTLVRKRLAQYNTMLDLVSQIETTLQSFSLINANLSTQLKVQDLKAAIFYDLKMIERDVDMTKINEVK